MEFILNYIERVAGVLKKTIKSGIIGEFLIND